MLKHEEEVSLIHRHSVIDHPCDEVHQPSRHILRIAIQLMSSLTALARSRRDARKTKQPGVYSQELLVGRNLDRRFWSIRAASRGRQCFHSVG